MIPAPQQIRTFFVTANCYQKQPLFRNRERAELLLDVFRTNREKGRFLLHEFVIMEDHFHVILTPAEDVSLEKAIQFIKGGFSFRVKKELGYKGEVWQESFTEHRIKDAEDYAHHREYIRMNPVRRGMVRRPEQYPYSSATIAMDERPPWLKPPSPDALTRP